MPEPAAPTARLTPTRMSAVTENGRALTPSSLNVELRPSITGSASSLARMRRTTATAAPMSPQMSPSSMNGPRMNQFEAPTREDREPDRVRDQDRRGDEEDDAAEQEDVLDHVRDLEDALRLLLGVVDLLHACGRRLEPRRQGRDLVGVLRRHLEGGRERIRGEILGQLGKALLHLRERVGLRHEADVLR